MVENNKIKSYKIVEDKANCKDLSDNMKMDADIQIAYLNILHEQGLITDSIHSIAVQKTYKGVI